MANLQDIRKRIASIKNTRKITSAMKMVSAAKLRRAQENAEAARPYALKMETVISSLVSRVDDAAHPLLEKRADEKRALVLIISSNRGLCGGYNTNIFRMMEKFVTDRGIAGIEVDIATIGRKAEINYRNRGPKVIKNYEDVIGNVNFANAKAIAHEAGELFTSGEYDLVYLAFNEFVSVIKYETAIHPLLPLTLEDVVSEVASIDESASEYIFEPDEKSLLATLIPAHIEVQVLRALLEAEASEHASRMTAMDSATTNAKDMISSLTLQYNRARQAYITKELVEIVSGAEALKG